MKLITAAPVLALMAIATTAQAALPMMYEEAAAHQEEQLIITAPIAGIQNKQWFNYRINILEAQKELTNDLRHAHKIKDQRHAWDEYGHELSHERKVYIHHMAKRGYRASVVTVGK